MAENAPVMTSNRPYLLRAIYDWISDNGFTPYILVDADHPGVRVPASAAREGKVVLNIAMRAVDNLELGNERIRCKARFGGVSQALDVPVSAVQAIYAQENGQGMMFPPEEPAGSTPAPSAPTAVSPSPEASREAAQQVSDAPPSEEPPPKGPPKLRVVK